MGVPPERLTSAVDAAPIAREPKRAQRPPSERRCKDCGLVKPIAAYVPIKQSRTGVYGRCRVCRARRARERYQSDPAEREAQKARVRRNDLERAAAAAATLRVAVAAGLVASDHPLLRWQGCFSLILPSTDDINSANLSPSVSLSRY